MTDVLPRLDGAFDEIDRRTIDRRQLLRAGAWAAPVIVLATAAPAAATSVDPASAGTGNVPASALFVDAYSVSDLNGNGTHGPLSWAGGQVGYWNAVQGIAVATFLWTAVLTKPGGTTLTIASGSGNVPCRSGSGHPRPGRRSEADRRREVHADSHDLRFAELDEVRRGDDLDLLTITAPAWQDPHRRGRSERPRRRPECRNRRHRRDPRRERPRPPSAPRLPPGRAR